MCWEETLTLFSLFFFCFPSSVYFKQIKIDLAL